MKIDYTIYLYFQFIFYGGYPVVTSECTITACEVIDILTQRAKDKPGVGGCTTDFHWRQLDRRLRAIEQPVWTISFGQSRWRTCTKSVCRCDVSRRALNCWRAGLSSLTSDLVVPGDIVTM